MYLEMHL